jgi:ectoine hydroxylase-related dioxygenase (phytanoyl-CoA dioxygenase family)
MMKPGGESDPRFYEYNRNEAEDSSKTLFHALGAWRVSPSFHDLVFFAPLAAAFARLLGGPVRLWHDQVFVKPARDGAVVAWHQDYSYWTRTKPVAHLTCWIGLDDSTLQNGCVHYVPGSHKWDLLPRGGLADEMGSVLAHLTSEQKAEFKPMPVELAVGEASFHHPMMLHGSYENRSDKPRRAAVINVFRDGVFSDTDEPLLAGVRPIPKGSRIEGQFFPLISPR